MLNDGFGKPLPDPPYEWILSRICEEFHIDPPRAAAIWDDDPILIAQVLELRAFAGAKAHIDGAKDWSELKLTDMVRRYMRIEADVMKGGL